MSKGRLKGRERGKSRGAPRHKPKASKPGRDNLRAQKAKAVRRGEGTCH